MGIADTYVQDDTLIVDGYAVFKVMQSRPFTLYIDTAYRAVVRTRHNTLLVINRGLIMFIELEIPDTLPHGHAVSFKKGIAEALLESARTPADYTPEGHDLNRELGKEVGKSLANKISKIVK